MRLRHIEVFHAIMQAGTISGAAQLLNISQPAATKVLQHCELHLGIKLFERIKGKLHPTPEAHKLYVEVDKLNRDLQSVKRLAFNLRHHPDEAVRMAATPTLSATIVPAAVIAWRKKFPKIHCSLAANHTQEIVNALVLGEIDFAISLYDPCHPGLQSESLIKACMMVAAPAGTWSQQLAHQSITLRELPKNLISVDLSDHLVSQVMDASEQQGVQFSSEIEVQTYLLAKSLVEAGMGAAILDPFTSASADRAKLQARPLQPEVHVELYLLSAKNTPLSRSARAFVDCLRQVASEFVSSQ